MDIIELSSGGGNVEILEIPEEELGIDSSLSDKSTIGFAFRFLNFLKKYKFYDNVVLYNKEYIPGNKSIASLESKNFITFKILICELFYKALNQIGDTIVQYSIACTNHKGYTARMIIGVTQSELDKEGELCIVKVCLNNYVYILSKDEITNLYICNRTNTYDEKFVNNIVSFLHMEDEQPTIKTSFISLKKSEKW